MRPALPLTTRSADETRSLGRAVAALLRPGDVISLTGDLGAGKTTFVQGAASGLGVEQPVLSPTFTLIREYDGTLRVYHVDVYRLDRLQDVLDLGFDELLDQGGIVFVEWGDAIDALLPEGHLQVELVLDEEKGTEARRMTVAALGRTWADRWDRLAEAVGPWSAGRGEA